MVMAAAPHAGGGAGWVLARPLRQPRTGNQHTTPDKPNRNRTLPRPPMIFRRLPASSSFVLAARGTGRSSLTPPGATGRPGSYEEDPEEQSGQPGDTTQATGSDLLCLLTPMALMGVE